jgi:hypothetical protein
MSQAQKENTGCNGVVRVPLRTAPAWPPAWIRPSVAIESGQSDPPAEPAPPLGRFDLAERWGPGLTDDDPAIGIPRDLRSLVAALPHDAWVRWRARSGELLGALGHAPTADDVQEADCAAAAELLAEGVAALPTDAPPVSIALSIASNGKAPILDPAQGGAKV